MKAKILRNLGRDLPDYQENQIVELTDEEFKKLSDLKLAEKADDNAPIGLQAVPEPVAVQAVPVSPTAFNKVPTQGRVRENG